MCWTAAPRPATTVRHQRWLLVFPPSRFSFLDNGDEPADASGCNLLRSLDMRACPTSIATLGVTATSNTDLSDSATFSNTFLAHWSAALARGDLPVRT